MDSEKRERVGLDRLDASMILGDMEVMELGRSQEFVEVVWGLAGEAKNRLVDVSHSYPPETEGNQILHEKMLMCSAVLVLVDEDGGVPGIHIFHRLGDYLQNGPSAPMGKLPSRNDLRMKRLRSSSSIVLSLRSSHSGQSLSSTRSRLTALWMTWDTNGATI